MGPHLLSFPFSFFSCYGCPESTEGGNAVPNCLALTKKHRTVWVCQRYNLRPISALKQLAELFDGEPCVADNPGHCERMNRVIPRDRQKAEPLGHHNVLTLSEDANPGPLQGLHRSELIDAGNLGQVQRETSISRTSESCRDSARAARYSRIASRMFSRASCPVFPWDQHPGKPGHETLKPSSDSCRTTLYFTGNSSRALWRKCRSQSGIHYGVRALRIFTNEPRRSSARVRPVNGSASCSVMAPQLMARRK